MTQEELLSEEKKMKSQKIMTAVFIGFIVGIAVFAATTKGFLLTIVLLGSAFMIGRNHTRSAKNLQEEINRRGSTIKHKQGYEKAHPLENRHIGWHLDSGNRRCLYSLSKR